jgi:hypothetical protein
VGLPARGERAIQSNAAGAGRKVLGIRHCTRRILRGRMQRRDFITLIDSAAAASPLAPGAGSRPYSAGLGGYGGYRTSGSTAVLW